MYAIVVESRSKYGYGIQYNYLSEISVLGELYSSYRNDALMLNREDAEKYLIKIKKSKMIEINEE